MERIIPGYTNQDSKSLEKLRLNPRANKNVNSYMSKRINGEWERESILKFTWGKIYNPEGNQSDNLIAELNILENPGLYIGTLLTDFSLLELVKREAARVDPSRLKITQWT